MSKIKYVMYRDKSLVPFLDDIIIRGLVSYYTEGPVIIIAAKGVNKSTLKKLLKKEIGE